MATLELISKLVTTRAVCRGKGLSERDRRESETLFQQKKTAYLFRGIPERRF